MSAFCHGPHPAREGQRAPTAWPSRWTALALLFAAWAVSLLAGWWPGVLFLVWTSLVRVGVTAVRRQTPVGAGASSGGAGPSRPGRAFAEGMLAALVPTRTFSAAPTPPQPATAPLPREGDQARVEQAVRDVVARLAAARADEGTP